MDWHPITPERPTPLDDVLVSVFDRADGDSTVFMAWRTTNGRWMVSGSDVELLLPVYAWARVPSVAAVPQEMQKEVAA